MRRKLLAAAAVEPEAKSMSATLGDSLMLDNEFKALPASELVKQFGEKFAARARRDADRTVARPD